MTGSATAKTTASSGLMEIAIPSARMSMTGARTSTLITIMYDICTLVMSVVRRVTRPAVLKRSRFAKLKSCIL